MIVLYILLGLLLLLFLLLLIPAGVDIRYRESAEITVCYGPLHLLHIDSEKKEAAPKKKKEAPAKTASKKKPAEKKQQAKSNPIKDYFVQLKEYRGFSGLVDFFVSLVKIVCGSASRLVGLISVPRAELYLLVRGEDPAETAIRYGQLCAVVYPAFSLLCQTKPCRRPAVEVDMDYEKGEMQGTFFVSLRAVPLAVLAEVLRLGWRALRLVLNNRCIPQPSQAPQKAPGQK